MNIEDFSVIADARNNPPSTLENHLNVRIEFKKACIDLTVSEDGRLIAINGVDVENKLFVGDILFARDRIPTSDSERAIAAISRDRVNQAFFDRELTPLPTQNTMLDVLSTTRHAPYAAMHFNTGRRSGVSTLMLLIMHAYPDAALVLLWESEIQKTLDFYPNLVGRILKEDDFAKSYERDPKRFNIVMYDFESQDSKIYPATDMLFALDKGSMRGSYEAVATSIANGTLLAWVG